MAYDLYTGNPEDETAKVAYLMQLFQQARLQRVNFEVMWEEAASLVWPEYRNSWAFGHVRAPGVKYTQYQVDNTATIAAWRFMAICDALITPFNMQWSVIRASDPYIMKQRGVRRYYNDLTKVLWAERYAPEANFMSQNQLNWHSLGVFGNHYMMIEQYDSTPLKTKNLRYISCSPGEIYRLVNHQGRTDGFIRHFRWSARQAFGRWPDTISRNLKAALDKADSITLFDFLQFVIPRTDYDPHKLFTNQAKPWWSCYVSVVDYSILEENGYYTFPLMAGGYIPAPEEWYYRGPAQQALAEMKTLNAEKEAFLKQGQLAGDPMYLLPDDSLFDFKAQAGSQAFGGVNAQGQPLVRPLETGNIQITTELMNDSKATINDAFLTSLFPLIFNQQNGQQRSAREVIEIANQMGIFLAPTLGTQFGSYCAPMNRRELDLLGRMGKLPPRPPVLREAKPNEILVPTSPLALALNGQEIAGFMRTVEMGQQAVNMTGDQGIMDAFDFDAAIPEIADYQHVPARWMASPQKVAQKRQQRAQAQQADQQLKALPGQAAIMKAKAISDKAQVGQNIGGALSGTPQGGMPMMPAPARGTPGRPGNGGGPGTPGQPAP